MSDVAKRGKREFDLHCAGCHSGPLYTDKKQYLIHWAKEWEREIKMDVPTLTEVWRTAPYLYDGRSFTIREMLDIHGPEKSLPDNQLNDLSEYILSL